MKISSQSNMGDIMSVGVNVAEQAKDTSSVPDFKAYMQQSASNQDRQSTQHVQAASKGQNVQAENSKNTDTAKREDGGKVNDRQTERTSKPERKENREVSEQQDMDEAADAGSELSEDVLSEMTEVLSTALPISQVAGLLNNIQNQIQELLGIDVQELNQLLDSLNMQLSDLLDGEAQKQLLLAAEGAKPLDLLTDEQLAGLLSQMNGIIDGAIGASDIEATTLQSALEQMNALKNADVENDPAVGMNGQTEDTMESVDGSHIRFTVDMDKDQEGSSATYQGEQTDLSAMKEQVIGQLNQTMGRLTEVTEVHETVTPAEIVNQVVEEIKLTARQDTTSIELQLYPEHLGKVAVQVSTRNGALTAQITAENEIARAALEASLQTLKETFQNQGLKVEAVEVMVGTSSFSQEQFMNQQTNQEETQSGSSGRRINLDELEGLEAADMLTEEEQLNVDMMRQEGRSVDYSA